MGGAIWAVVLFAFKPRKRKQIHVIPIRVIHFSLGKKTRSPEEYGQVGGFSLKADLQKVFAQRPTRHLLPPLWRSGRFVWGHPAVFVPTPCAWTRNAHCDALSFSSGWDQFDPTKISQFPSDKLTWQWNISIFNRKYVLKGSIFHCYVSVVESMQHCTTKHSSLFFASRFYQVRFCKSCVQQAQMVIHIALDAQRCCACFNSKLHQTWWRERCKMMVSYSLLSSFLTYILDLWGVHELVYNLKPLEGQKSLSSRCGRRTRQRPAKVAGWKRFFSKGTDGLHFAPCLAPDLDPPILWMAADLDQRFSMMPLAAASYFIIYVIQSHCPKYYVYTLWMLEMNIHIYFYNHIYIYMRSVFTFVHSSLTPFHRSCIQVALLSHHNSLVESGDSGFARWPGPTMVALGWGPAGSCSQMWLGHQLLGLVALRRGYGMVSQRNL